MNETQTYPSIQTRLETKKVFYPQAAAVTLVALIPSALLAEVFIPSSPSEEINFASFLIISYLIFISVMRFDYYLSEKYNREPSN